MVTLPPGSWFSSWRVRLYLGLRRKRAWVWADKCNQCNAEKEFVGMCFASTPEGGDIADKRNVWPCVLSFLLHYKALILRFVFTSLFKSDFNPEPEAQDCFLFFLELCCLWTRIEWTFTCFQLGLSVKWLVSHNCPADPIESNIGRIATGYLWETRCLIFSG